MDHETGRTAHEQPLRRTFLHPVCAQPRPEAWVRHHACGALLILYWRDMRERFGSEMSETFAQQLIEAWEKHRVLGALSIWSLALPGITLQTRFHDKFMRPVVTLPSFQSLEQARSTPVTLGTRSSIDAERPVSQR